MKKIRKEELESLEQAWQTLRDLTVRVVPSAATLGIYVTIGGVLALLLVFPLGGERWLATMAVAAMLTPSDKDRLVRFRHQAKRTFKRIIREVADTIMKVTVQAALFCLIPFILLGFLQR